MKEVWVFNSLIVLVVGLEHCLDPKNRPVTTCTECLALPECVWCEDRSDRDKPATGCIKETSSSSCRKLYEPLKANMVVTSPFKNNQIWPAGVKITAPPNHPVDFSFQVQLADNPVDIYFVMDLSGSMEDDKENLVKAANRIADQVKSLTSDFKIGFGSFSDKPTTPFAAEPETYGKYKMEVPYSFRSHMRLTREVEQFKEAVAGSTLTSNMDRPEGGLDGLMQAIVCDEEIGWRSSDSRVRKVIIFITDVGSHYAYDGLLAGISRPNDGSCHMKLNRSGGFMYYDKELDLDYPSFSRLREEVRRKNMAVIFAVAGFYSEMYKELSMLIQGAEYVGFLTKDPESIEKIVTENYKSIKNRVAIQVNNLFPYHGIDIAMKSNCPRQSDNPFVCPEVKESESVDFTGTLTISNTFCQDYGSHSFQLSLTGFSSDRITVAVECEKCQCSGAQINSPICNNRNGDLICGGCQCHEGFVGDSCECSVGEEDDVTQVFEDKCISNRSSEVCNGRGDCFCGSCKCRSDSLGQFCGCRLDSCPHRNGLICSGNGQCSCDEETQETTCKCNPGWSGEDCRCTANLQACRDHIQGDICFGRGDCQCGKCQCHEGFEGAFCQRKIGVSTCNDLRPCLLHHEFEGHPNTETWADECERNMDLVYSKSTVKLGCQMKSENTDKIDIKTALGLDNCTDLVALNDSSSEEGGLGGITDRLHSGYYSIAESEYQRCAVEFQDCQFVFYHNFIGTDEFFEDKSSRGQIVVVHHNDSGRWTPLISCATSVPLAVVLGVSVGCFVFLGLLAIVAIIILINLNDLRQWKRYLAMVAANEARLGQMENPLYQEKTGAQSTFQNPAFGQS